MTLRAEIAGALRTSLDATLDSELKQRGFSRPTRGLKYTRRLANAVQALDIAFEVHPSDKPNAAGAVYPWLEVLMPDVDAKLGEMVNGDLGLLAGVTAGVLREPIAFTSAKAEPARWFVYQPDTVPAVVVSLKSFLLRWTLPFLDYYSTAEAMIEAEEGNDERVLRDRAQRLRAIAATLVHRGPRAALDKMNRHFGSPGLRNRYRAVFGYLAGQVQ